MESIVPALAIALPPGGEMGGANKILTFQAVLLSYILFTLCSFRNFILVPFLT